MKHTIVAITCIGSGIGQAVITALRCSPAPFKTLGLGNNPFAFGAQECDVHDSLPSIYAHDYIEQLIERCREYGATVVIPGMDDELLILAKAKSKLYEVGIALLVADARLVSLCNDKLRLGQALNTMGNRFAKSFSVHDAYNSITNGTLLCPCVAKPRRGGASTNINLIMSANELEGVPDEYVVQALLAPSKEDPNYVAFTHGVESGELHQLSEVSVQVVVDQNGEELGRAATLNRLEKGVPIEIIPIDEPDIWQAVDEVMPWFLEQGLRGPLNLQGRRTEEGLVFFEANPRFTGITGLRAKMGFNEVEACLRHWLNPGASKQILQISDRKYGMRQVVDKTNAIENNPQLYSKIQKNSTVCAPFRKVMFVTGATGYLARNLISTLSMADKYSIIALSRDKKHAQAILPKNVSHVVDIKDMEQGLISWGNVDVLLHCGFARPHMDEQSIADSLKFTQKIFHLVAGHQVPEVINISSQSIYGQGTPPPWLENSSVAPQNPYGVAKYATELMLQAVKQNNPHLHTTSIRLASLSGGMDGLVEVDLVSKFVKQALAGDAIELHGYHELERLDIRDAIAGLVQLLEVPSDQWQTVYNLGRGETVGIDELAHVVSEEVAKSTGKAVPCNQVSEIQGLQFGMDSNAFFRDTGWQPSYTLTETVQSLIQYFQD